MKVAEKEVKTSGNTEQDTGLRGNFHGDLYIDREVYFKRPEVQAFLKKMRESKAYPKVPSPTFNH